MGAVVDNKGSEIQQQVNLWSQFPYRERACIVFAVVFIVFGVLCTLVGVVCGSVTTSFLGLSIYILSALVLLRGIVVYNRFGSNYLLYDSQDLIDPKELKISLPLS
ncbi:hypothetical protein [Chlamydia vaughanii]|uniref:hypothetical protein n=1 Tax=Chlamydia vaughanii TaxID=3112552 RepID=UPI0032B2A50D